MGCDGGTIPTRDELVRLKKKPEKKDKSSELVARWKHCAITQEALRQPIMACELGKLYNKESLLEFLLDKSKFEEAAGFDHLRGLKDVKELKLTDNPAFHKQNVVGDAYVDRLLAAYICPITGLEMSGRHRFCYLRACGCVFAERALKEVKAEACNTCGTPYVEDDVIILNGTDEDVDLLKAKMEFRRLQAKLEKKSKKRSKTATATATSSSSSESNGDATEDGPSTSKRAKGDDKSAVNGKVGSKLANGVAGGAAGSKSTIEKVESEIEKLKKKSIQKDSKASSVYKSLFTTCEKARNQPKGHWVTYNPQYN